MLQLNYSILDAANFSTDQGDVGEGQIEGQAFGEGDVINALTSKEALTSGHQDALIGIDQTSVKTASIPGSAGISGQIEPKPGTSGSVGQIEPIPGTSGTSVQHSSNNLESSRSSNSVEGNSTWLQYSDLMSESYPVKSKFVYLKAYRDFEKFLKSRNQWVANTCPTDLQVLNYFFHLRHDLKFAPTTL